MKNVNFISDENKTGGKVTHMSQRAFEYKSYVEVFDFLELKRLISFFNGIESKFGNIKYCKYVINYFNKVKFIDKLTYILLECFLYNEIIKKNKNILLQINNVARTIFTEGVYSSCLAYTNDRLKFETLFMSITERYHFRRVIKFEDRKKNSSLVSLLFADLQQFLVTCGISEKNSVYSAEVMVELVDNALEHAQSDCLADIDVSQDYYNKEVSDDSFFAVNIVVVDFSNDIIGNAIGEKLKNSIELNSNYQKLKVLKQRHETYFNNNYTSQDFDLMSTFQNKITSRQGSNYSGGTGLTKLIERLQVSSISNICYVVAGNRCLFFKKEFIKQDSNKWVGFNKENDCNLKPDENIFKTSPINVIGTAYNLAFVFKKEN